MSSNWEYNRTVRAVRVCTYNRRNLQLDETRLAEQDMQLPSVLMPGREDRYRSHVENRKIFSHPASLTVGPSPIEQVARSLQNRILDRIEERVRRKYLLEMQEVEQMMLEGRRSSLRTRYLDDEQDEEEKQWVRDQKFANFHASNLFTKAHVDAKPKGPCQDLLRAEFDEVCSNLMAQMHADIRKAREMQEGEQRKRHRGMTTMRLFDD